MSNIESYITKIRFREDTSLNWEENNPILASSEPARETDTGKIKIGDGNKNWNDLPYLNNSIETFENYNDFILALQSSYDKDLIKTFKITVKNNFEGNLYKVSFNISNNTYVLDENFNQQLLTKDDIIYTNNYYISGLEGDKKIGIIIAKNGYDLILEIPLKQTTTKDISMIIKSKSEINIPKLDKWEISGRATPITISEGNVDSCLEFAMIYNN